MNRGSSIALVALIFLPAVIFLCLLIYSSLPPDKERSGKEIFMTFCRSCHLYGSTGAPPLGNKEAWAERREKGIEILTAHAMEGFQGMPARGICLNCRENEIKSAIEYMIAESR